MVYRLERDKLNEKAIEPFIEVVKRPPRTRALVVGGGGLLPEFAEAVSAAGFDHAFEFTGYVSYEELPDLYRRMAVFVAPVWKESFGQVSSFAMNMGVPVCGYDVGAIGEIVDDDALVARAGDAQALARVIVRCSIPPRNAPATRSGCANSCRACTPSSPWWPLTAACTKNCWAGRHHEHRPFRALLLPGPLLRDGGIHAEPGAELPGVRPPGHGRLCHLPGREVQRRRCLSRYQYAGVDVVCIDKNRCPTRASRKRTPGGHAPVLEKVLRELRPDVVHVTHLINHTAVLLEVTRELGIPTYASFTDFFGFCLNNKLEAADGELCAGPSPSRSNCMACYVKDAARNPSVPGWMRRSVDILGPQVCATGANLARKLPGVRPGAWGELLEDIAQRPQTLVPLYNAAYRAAVSPTRFLRSAYEANGITVPIRDIWFGIDVDRRPKPQRPAGHVPVIGFVGQIAPHKGTDLLIEAFRRLPRGTAELHVYGPADQDPAFMARLRALAEGHDVRFLGTFPKERESEILRTMDVLVIPSRWYENSPLVLLSALASHTPVVVSDVAGLTEFVQPGVNGEAFERGSADALHATLRKLLSDPSLLGAMSTATSFERGTEDMARDTLALYA